MLMCGFVKGIGIRYEPYTYMLFYIPYHIMYTICIYHNIYVFCIPKLSLNRMTYQESEQGIYSK